MGTLHKDLVGANLHIGRAQLQASTPVGTITPGIIGQLNWDSANNKLYIAEGLTVSDWINASDAVDEFLELTDTPSTFTAQANKIVKVNSGATALEFSADITLDSLSLDSATGVLRLPRLTTTQRDALTPLSGMTIFNTTTLQVEDYNGTGWVGASELDEWTELSDTPSAISAGLVVQGNAGGTALEFGQALDTTDSPTFATPAVTRIRAGAGTVALPAYSFTSNTDRGIRDTGSSLRLTDDGIDVLELSSADSLSDTFLTLISRNSDIAGDFLLSVEGTETDVSLDIRAKGGGGLFLENGVTGGSVAIGVGSGVTINTDGAVNLGQGGGIFSVVDGLTVKVRAPTPTFTKSVLSIDSPSNQAQQLRLGINDLAVNNGDAFITAFGTTELVLSTSTGEAIGISGIDVNILGNLTVSGTTTTIDTTTLLVEDKNIELGNVTTPTDITADGGGLTLLGATSKTWNWVSATDAWTANKNINLLTGFAYKINGVSVLNATTLGSGVLNSSLTSVGSTLSIGGENAVTTADALDTLTLMVGAGTNSIQAVDAAASTANISVDSGFQMIQINAAVDGHVAYRLLDNTGTLKSEFLYEDDLDVAGFFSASPFVFTINSSLSLNVLTAMDFTASTGDFTFKTSTNSLTALQVQNASSTPVINVDTINLRFGVGIVAPLSTLHVVGDLRLTGPLLDSSGDAGTSGQVLSSLVTGTNWIDAGDGNVSNTGTPLDGQVAVFVDATTIEGTTGFTFDADTLTVTEGSIVQTPGDPTLAGSVLNSSIINQATGIYVVDDFAYVTGQLSDSLAIFNVSIKTAPVLVGSLLDSINLDAPTGVFVVGNYAYVTAGGVDSLVIIDVSDPTTPVFVGSLIDSTNMDSPTAVYVSGKYAYVTGFSSTSLAIVDISVKASPELVGSVIDATNLNGGASLYVRGDFAYVAAFEGDRVTIVDVSDPANPAVVGNLFDGTNLNGATAITVVGKYAYVVAFVSSSFAIIDISDPSAPSLTGSFIDIPNMLRPRGIYVAGDYAYVTENSGGKVHVVDVSTPASPSIVATLTDITNLNGAFGIFVAGTHAYVASQISDSLSVVAIDGVDATVASIGSLQTCNLNVSENAVVGNNLSARAMNIGGDAKIDGSLSVADQLHVVLDAEQLRLSSTIDNYAAFTVAAAVFDLSAADFDSVSFDISTQDIIPTGIEFNTDGTSMYIVGNANDTIFQYTLSRAFDLGSASFASKQFSISQDTLPQDVAFNADGTRMFVVGLTNTNIFQYDLSTGFDVSTAVYNSVFFDIGTEDTFPSGVVFNAAGTSMYVSGSGNDVVSQYTLTTGFDVSTASITSSFSVANEASSSGGVAFNIAGTKMFVLDGPTNIVYQYDLSTGFDVTTAVYNAVSFSVAAQDTSPTGVVFNADGSKMYITGNSNNTAYEYVLGELTISPSGGQLNVAGNMVVSRGNSDSSAMLTLENTGVNAGKTATFVGSQDPNLVVQGMGGDLYVRDNAAISNLFFSKEATTGTGWKTVGLNNPEIHEIFSAADYEDLASGGIITTADLTTTFDFKADIVTATRLVISDPTHELQFLNDSETKSIIYVGSPTYITGTVGGDITCRNSTFVSGIAGRQFLDYLGDGRIPAIDVVTFSESSTIFGYNLGTVGRLSTAERGPIFNINEGSALINLTSGLVVDAVSIFGLQSVYIDQQTEVGIGGPVVTITDSSYKSGRATFVTLVGSLFSGESLVRVDAGLPDTYRVNVFNTNLVLNGTATIFDTSGSTDAFTAVADNSIAATAISGVTDNSGVAVFAASTTPLLGSLATVSGFTTNTGYNTTGIVTAVTVGVSFEIDYVAFGSTETGSYLVNAVTVTAVAHGQTLGTGVTLDTTLSIDYDGGFLIYNIQTDSFDIQSAFFATESGTWSTEGLDQTDPRVLTSNNPGTAESHAIACASVNDNSTLNGTIVNNTFTDMVFGVALTALVESSTTERWKLIDDVNGTFAYKGLEPFNGLITFDFTVVSAGGVVNFRFKWQISTDGGSSFSDLPDAVEALIAVGGNEAKSVTKTFPLLVEKGDQIKPQITRNSGSSSITTSYASIYATD